MTNNIDSQDNNFSSAESIHIIMRIAVQYIAFQCLYHHA
jgi:hypothetical protein